MSLFAAALLAAAVPAFAQATPAVDAQSAGVLDAVRTAMVHRPLASLTSLHLTGTQTSAGLPAAFQEWDDVKGLRFAQASVGGPLTGTTGWDGSVNWSQDGTGLVHRDAGASARVQAIDQAYLDNLGFLQPNAAGATVTYGGTKTAGASTYDILKVTPHGGSEADLWVDTTTHLIAKETGKVGIVDFTVAFSDYRTSHGVTLPFAQTVTISTGNTQSQTLTSVEVNTDVRARTKEPASTNRDASIAGKTTTVPIQIINNHIYVQGRVNGRGPFTFILDTGGAFIISPELAAALKTGSSGGVQIGGVGDTTEAAGFTHIDLLQFGAASVKDQYALVLPIDKGFGVAEGLHIDGMIGYEFVARFLTTIDYARQTMTLAPLGPKPAVVAGATAIPFFFNGTIPNVPIVIDGIPANGEFDTGSRGSLTLTSPFVGAHPHLASKIETGDGVAGFGIGGPSLAKLGRLDSLQIGPFVLAKPIVAFGTQSQGAFADPLGGQNVGGDVWKRFTVTFDYPHYRLLLAPNATIASAFNYDRSGLFVIDKAGAHVVLGVRDGTAGAIAGLAKGDTILSVDGAPAAGLSLAQLRTAFSGPAGTAIKLHVKNATGERDVVLTLKDYV